MILMVRDALGGSIDESDRIEEGLLYPVPLDQPNQVATEARDGADIRRVSWTGIELGVHGEKRPMLSSTDISGEMLITDARVTIACSKYDRGGGHWGVGAGALLALPLNVGSKVRAARRRRGKMLVGHVRYPWLGSVYAQSKHGWLSAERLRLFVNVGGGDVLHLKLTLPKNADAAALGTEIIRRAAAFRLAHDRDPIEEPALTEFRALATAAPLVPIGGSGTDPGHRFPTSWRVSEESARFGASPTEGRLHPPGVTR